jgi:hypothetical protein
VTSFSHIWESYVKAVYIFKKQYIWQVVGGVAVLVLMLGMEFESCDKVSILFKINEFIYKWIYWIDESIDFCKWIHRFFQMNSSIFADEFIDFADEFTNFAMQNKWIYLIVINEFI